jgi:hypothetical protein
MAYTKMTVTEFKKRLNSGLYEAPGGARRAIGKADFDDDTKTKCHKAILKHFGEGAVKPKAAKKETKKTAAKAVKSVKKAAAKPVEAEAPASKKKAAKGTPRVKRAAASVLTVDAAALADLHLANERIGTIMQAIETMKAAKEAYPELDTSEGAAVAGAALTDIMQSVHKTVRGEQLELPDPTVLENLAKTAPAAQGLPGHESPVRVPDNSTPVVLPAVRPSLTGAS